MLSSIYKLADTKVRKCIINMDQLEFVFEPEVSLNCSHWPAMFFLHIACVPVE